MRDWGWSSPSWTGSHCWTSQPLTFHRGPWSGLWDHGLSHCHFLSGIKNVFFNDIVLAKGSYKGKGAKGYKFVACFILENALERLESAVPSLGRTLGPLWWPCARH